MFKVLAAAALTSWAAGGVPPASIVLVQSGEVACPSSGAIARAFTERFGTSLRSGEARVGDYVVRVAQAKDERVELRLERAPSEMVVVRLFAKQADCDEFARTLALVVEARLARLPWGESVAEPKRGPATSPAPKAVEPSQARFEKRPMGRSEVAPPASHPPRSVELAQPEPASVTAAQESRETEAQKRAPSVVHASNEELNPPAREKPPAEKSEEAEPSRLVEAPKEPSFIAPPPPKLEVTTASASSAEPVPEIPYRLVAHVLGGAGLDANVTATALQGDLRIGVAIIPWLELLLDGGLASTLAAKVGAGSTRIEVQHLDLMARARLFRGEDVRLDLGLAVGAAHLYAAAAGFPANLSVELYRALFGLSAEIGYDFTPRVGVTLAVQGWLRSHDDQFIVDGPDSYRLGFFRLQVLGGLRVGIL